MDLADCETFIFDWDGTLRSVSTARKLNATFNPDWRRRKAIAKGNVRKPSKREIATNLHHVHTVSTLAELRNAETWALTFVADLSLAFIVPRLSYGSRETLETLDRAGKKIALFTDAALWRAGRELEHAGVTRYFDAVLSAQSIHRLKPDPLGIEIILKALGSEKRTSIYIGDGVDDIEAARNAGIFSGVVTNGFDSASMLKEHRPDYLFSSLEELRKALVSRRKKA